MTEEQITQFWEEVEQDKRIIKFHCKPTYQFQSIEFDYECSRDEINKMIEIYNDVLQHLITIAPEQEKKPVQTINLATDKQKDIMKKFGIKFNSLTTREEAQKLIQESIENTK